MWHDHLALQPTRSEGCARSGFSMSPEGFHGERGHGSVVALPCGIRPSQFFPQPAVLVKRCLVFCRWAARFRVHCLGASDELDCCRSSEDRRMRIMPYYNKKSSCGRCWLSNAENAAHLTLANAVKCYCLFLDIQGLQYPNKALATAASSAAP